MSDLAIVSHPSGLVLVRVPLTSEEIEKCLELGKKRTEYDEGYLGWRYRHHGKPSERAHGIGFIGELAFEKWLQSKGLVKGKDYRVAPAFVDRIEKIEQDFTIYWQGRTKTVGVKTANSSLERALQYGSFLYPAKSTLGESKRVLGYPDFLVQTIAEVNEKVCWLCGFVEQQVIRASAIVHIHGKPTHKIPFNKWCPAEELFEAIEKNP
jgi:hypothetical protein